MLLGLLYERYRTYDMREYGGLAQKLPWIVTMFVLTALSVVGLPMLNGFVGEFLIFSGAMQSAIAHHIGWTTLATTGVILTASYMLWMIQRVFYGELGRRSESVTAPDLNGREHLALWPLVALFLFMGVASPVFMNIINTAGAQITETINHTQAVNMNFEAAKKHEGSPTTSTMTTASIATKGAQ
jgi:NADH-quinone oxidoreductase subunit M